MTLDIERLIRIDAPVEHFLAKQSSSIITLPQAIFIDEESLNATLGKAKNDCDLISLYFTSSFHSTTIFPFIPPRSKTAQLFKMAIFNNRELDLLDNNKKPIIKVLSFFDKSKFLPEILIKKFIYDALS